MLYEYVETHKAGESGYYAEHKRGTVDVWHDSKRYIYRKPCRPLREFKADLAEAFASRGGPPAKIVGQYPSYTVETRG